MSQHPNTGSPDSASRCTCPPLEGDVADGQEGTHLRESRFINGPAPAAWRGFLFAGRWVGAWTSLKRRGGRRRARRRPWRRACGPAPWTSLSGRTRWWAPDRSCGGWPRPGALTSLILYGPPGTGKTTLARILAEAAAAHFETVNAVTSGVADIRRAIQEAKERATLYGQGTVRLHRRDPPLQQGAAGRAPAGGGGRHRSSSIGATTENPYFAVNAPLLSRRAGGAARTAERRARSRSLIAAGPRRRTSGGWAAGGSPWTPDAQAHLIRLASGDARVALNTLELAALGAADGRTARSPCELRRGGGAAQRCSATTRTGDDHYDTISAFIKSMRGSDPDAALYWLARMLEAGEDPRFIARRILIHACEDVGNADPQALVVAAAAATPSIASGMPEAQLALAQAALVHRHRAEEQRGHLRRWRRAREDMRSRRAPGGAASSAGRPLPGRRRAGPRRKATFTPTMSPSGLCDPRSTWPEGLRGPPSTSRRGTATSG